MDTPYKGLQPYTELDKDNFYGRATEKRILMDKILIHKLTFLFAASGVGKSSLLRAAVLPALIEPPNSYDVVYYNDWVEQPLLNLKSHIADTLRRHGRVTSDFEFDTSLSLKAFLRICTVFTSAPFILILDQFEEFFNYQKYHQDSFKQFVEEIAQAVHDHTTDTAFVIAMREDFALELNAFKEAMPTFLIDNFYRLERLSLANARKAIETPLEKMGFRYEAGLLDALVQDLSEREKVEREGLQSQEWVMAELVEPPHLQIVCQQLWELDRGRADKEIKRATYVRKGLAVGLLENYFKDKIEAFSYQNKLIASNSFNYLVNKHGTKMAYPLPDLAKQINKSENDLQPVLDKLEVARVLRRQKRKETLWYELYHDMFSRSIYDWNERFKRQLLISRFAKGFAGTVVIGTLLFVGYDYWDNKTHYHRKINFAEGIDAPVQVWQGQYDSWDIWKQHKFLHELSYSRTDIEPDKLFNMQEIKDIEHVHQEMVLQLPLVQRVQAYYNAGYLNKAVEDIAKCSIQETNLQRSKEIIKALKTLKVKDGVNLLIEQLESSHHLKLEISNSINKLYVPLFFIQELLTRKNTEIRLLALEYLSILGGREAENILLNLLSDSDLEIKQKSIEKLAILKVKKSIPKFIEFLHDEDLRINAIQALAKIKDKAIISQLRPFLKTTDDNFYQEVVWTLVQLEDQMIIPDLVKLLNNPVESTSKRAINAIISLKHRKSLPLIYPLLKDAPTSVRIAAIQAIKTLGSEQSLTEIFPLLKSDSNSYIKSQGLAAILELGSEESLIHVLPLLEDSSGEIYSLVIETITTLANKQALLQVLLLLESYKQKMRDAVVEIFSKLNLEQSSVILPHIIALFDHDNPNVRQGAVKIIDSFNDRQKNIVLPKLFLLINDDNFDVRLNVLQAISSIKQNKNVLKLDISKIIPFLNDNNEDIRYYSAHILGKFKHEVNKEILRNLLPLLRDSDADIRNLAVKILGKTGDKQILSQIRNLLKDFNEDVRLSTVSLLGELGNKDILNDIFSLLEIESNDEVKLAAVWAIASLGDKKSFNRMLNILKESNLFNEWNVFEPLIELGKSLELSDITPLLKDSNSNVRYSAIKILKFFDHKDVLSKAIILLKDSDEDVRLEAVRILKELKDERAIFHLLPLIKDPSTDVCQNIVQSLGELDGSQGLFHNQRVFKNINVCSGYNINQVINSISKQAIPYTFPFVDQEVLSSFDSNFLSTPTIRIARKNNYSILLGSALNISYKIAGYVDGESTFYFDENSSTSHLARLNSKQLLPLLISSLDTQKDAVLHLGQTTIDIGVSKPLIHLFGLNKVTEHSFYEYIQFYFELRKVQSEKEEDIIDSINELKELGMLDLKRTANLLLETSLRHISEFQIQRAIADTLVHLLQETNGSEILYPIFKQFIQEKKIDFFARLALFRKLDTIDSSELNFIFNTIQQEQGLDNRESLKFTGYRILAKKRQPEVFNYLKQELNYIVQNKKIWREQQQTQVINEQTCGQQETNQEWKYTYWESRIAYSLAQNNPQYALDKLLNHPLANVRQGAWQGLAFMMKDIKGVLSGGKLFEKIYDLHHKTNQAYIRHATYRAIDLSLTSLEAVGKQKDLDKLEEIFAKHQELKNKPEQQTPQHKAILQRIEWSKAMLDHRLNQLNIDELRERFKNELVEAEE